MLEKVRIIKGGSQYGVMRDFADALAEGFKEQRIEVHIYDATMKENKDYNLRLREKDYDMILSFNGMILGVQEQLIKNPNTLFWSFLVDHPYYHHWRLLTKCNNHIVSCVDRKHVDYVKKYYPNVDKICYMPHGGNVPHMDSVPYENREYNVCFMGTFRDLKDYEERIESLQEPDRTIMISIANEMKAGSKETFEGLLDKELQKRGIQITQSQYTDFLNVVSFVDTYVRMYNRKVILDSLTSNGIIVDVFGNGWENYKCEHPEFIRIHGNIPYDEVLRVMSNSKIIINILPLFRDGSHERVFTSMLCGGVCVSEINAYLSETFKHGEDIVFFDMQNLDTLCANIKELLNNTELGDSIAKKGKEKVNNEHLWKNRAYDIVKIASEVLEKQDYSKKYVDIQNQTDYEFNNIVRYIDENSPRLLANKLKAVYHSFTLTEAEYSSELKSLLLKKGVWPIEDVAGNIYFRDEIMDLKKNLAEYVWLYNVLGDLESKKTLLGILQNNLSFIPKYLFDNIANELMIDEGEAVLSLDVTKANEDVICALKDRIESDKPKLMIWLEGKRENIWKLPKLIHNINSSYKLYFRYYGKNIIPENVILYGL